MVIAAGIELVSLGLIPVFVSCIISNDLNSTL